MPVCLAAVDQSKFGSAWRAGDTQIDQLLREAAPLAHARQGVPRWPKERKEERPGIAGTEVPAQAFLAGNEKGHLVIRQGQNLAARNRNRHGQARGRVNHRRTETRRETRTLE